MGRSRAWPPFPCGEDFGRLWPVQLSAVRYTRLASPGDGSWLLTVAAAVVVTRRQTLTHPSLCKVPQLGEAHVKSGIHVFSPGVPWGEGRGDEPALLKAPGERMAPGQRASPRGPLEEPGPRLLAPARGRPRVRFPGNRPALPEESGGSGAGGRGPAT